jgi:hypothetical protein
MIGQKFVSTAYFEKERILSWETFADLGSDGLERFNPNLDCNRDKSEVANRRRFSTMA